MDQRNDIPEANGESFDGFSFREAEGDIQAKETESAPSESLASDAYSGVFSSEAKPQAGLNRTGGRRQRKNSVLFLCVTVLLCVTLSFGASFAAVMLGLHLAGGDDGNESNADDPLHGFLPFPDPNRESTEPDEIFLEDPESVLDKTDSSASPFGSAGEDVFSVSEAAARVQNAVVVIDATVVSENWFGQGSESVSSGSGVVISGDGYIVTCNHVVEGAKSIRVSLNDGTVYEARLVGDDAASDLAVLKIEPKKTLSYVQQGCSRDLVIGERVLAIGNPLGTLGGTVTTGIISATEREITMSDGTKMSLVQTDAAINSGNSGGGLFNLDGQLVGIVNAKYSASGVEGLAFAIPVDFAYRVQLDLLQYGYVRGTVDSGLSFLDIPESELRYYYARFGIEAAGIYISDYPEYATELMPQDRVISVDGKTFANKNLLEEMLASHEVGDTVTFEVSRADGEDKNGKTKYKTVTVDVVLREYVPDRLKQDDEKK